MEPTKNSGLQPPSAAWLLLFVFLSFLCPILVAQLDVRYRSLPALVYVFVCLASLFLYLVVRYRFLRANPEASGMRLPWESAASLKPNIVWLLIGLLFFLVSLGFGLFLFLHKGSTI